MKALWRLENGGILFKLTAEGKIALQGSGGVRGKGEVGQWSRGDALLTRISYFVSRHLSFVTYVTDRAKMGDG